MLEPTASFLGTRGSSASRRPWACREPQVLHIHGHRSPRRAQQHGTGTELWSGALRCDQLLQGISFAGNAAEISATFPVSCATGIFGPTMFPSNAL